MKGLFKNKSKKQNYPEYWTSYEANFSNKEANDIKNTRFVVLDTETTGFNFITDRILCIGAVEIINNEIAVSNNFEVYIHQEHFNNESVEIHGLIKNERLKTLTEEEAIIQFLNYIGNAVLVAHHAVFDITMINNMLMRRGLPKLKNSVLDTMHLYKATRIKSNLIKQSNYSLDEIADNYALDVLDRHTAAGDALITAIIFLKTTRLLKKKKNYGLKKLFKL